MSVNKPADKPAQVSAPNHWARPCDCRPLNVQTTLQQPRPSGGQVTRSVAGHASKTGTSMNHKSCDTHKSCSAGQAPISKTYREHQTSVKRAASDQRLKRLFILARRQCWPSCFARTLRAATLSGWLARSLCPGAPHTVAARSLHPGHERESGESYLHLARGKIHMSALGGLWFNRFSAVSS